MTTQFGFGMFMEMFGPRFEDSCLLVEFIFLAREINDPVQRESLGVEGRLCCRTIAVFALKC